MSEMRVAVIGAGISGLVAATVLAKGGAKVVLYEKEDYLGGHAKTVTVDGCKLDLGFMVFNRVTYPNMMEFFESLGVDMEESDMSFSVSLDRGQGCEWGSRNGLSSLFAQKKNILNPYFWQMIREISKFKDDVLRYLEDLENNPDIERNETLGHFIKSRSYSDLFQNAYLVPICASIWSCPSEGVMSFSAYYVLSFCRNHHLLQLFGRPQWITVRWRSQDYVNKVREQLESGGCQIRSGCEVHSVSSIDGGCLVTCQDGSQEKYSGCIMATHAPDALNMLGKQATLDETRILGAFQYVYSDIFLHRDKKFMPQNPAAWSAWNFLGTIDKKVCLTYWLNVLQNIRETELPYLVTLNPTRTPDHTLLKWSTGHPVPSVAASKASFELSLIQGRRGIWFCGAYQGYGFHEDGLKAGLVAAHGMLRKSYAILSNPKHMVPSWMETGARLFVTRFLGQYISTGCLILLEEGGTVITFEGAGKKCLLTTSLRVHSPQFYWKIATQGDLGLADAYINGDFSLVDKNEGLQNLFMILIANRDLKNSISKKRGWWTPLLVTACIGSAKYFSRHISRQNTLTQARRNISRHYDLSNELFALFLDESMTYSCAVFKSEDEDLKVAQMRKISLLIEKARIDKEHEILEIGCGWGSLAIEVVKRTGCKYTGITLSEEQLRFAEMKVNKAGLQDRIKFLLCDYRQLPDTYKYNRIISCEMIEAVGHEYMEEFFGCCDSVLAEDGLLVLQFISIPDERYDEYRQSSDFIKEYIFPGGCLPSLSRITSAMAASSRLCAEHLENIGIHYHQTLRCWRNNFLEQQSAIIALGFNEKFIRTWEYYFDYSAAGFKSNTLGNYQIVFSRPGNVSTLGNPYKGIPSVIDHLAKLKIDAQLTDSTGSITATVFGKEAEEIFTTTTAEIKKSSLTVGGRPELQPREEGQHIGGVMAATVLKNISEAGQVAAYGVLRKTCAVLNNPIHMVPSLMETGARLLVIRFLKQYISTGCLILMEDGGTVLTFEGTGKKCLLKTSIRVHSLQFYWKIATQADLGLADAYINGDFSLVDTNEGLQNLFMIFIANRDIKSSVSKRRGWWTPLLFTAWIGSAKNFFQHITRQNTITQARRNISRHYDLSNELFALFLDETMSYSSAIFKSEDEDLKVAQMRKISLLIEKARINKDHEILEIGCGWGTLAVEVVKRTGCKYTGITPSEEQLRFAEIKVKEAGLQDRIKFILCDYRQLPETFKYDRIISCEMIEHVGHEYMEEFFGCCDSALAENGLLILQSISIPDYRYDEYRQSSDFIKEYIFPGGSLPSLSRITSAMAASSRLCVEHLENIGIHYHRTLRCWRKNFLEQQSQIIALGFNEKFIRTWEYYFDYCAAGFKSRTLGDYQFKPEEITAIMNYFAEPRTLAQAGLYLGGTKYMVIQREAGAVIRGN